MIGKKPEQIPLFDVGNVYDLKLDPTTFHAQLAVAAPKLFKDEDFAPFYHANNGRPSAPPSLLALTLILQFHDGVSDEEAINHTAYDLRWAAVLNRHAGTFLCAKSTLQLFRSHLILHPEVRSIFQASIEEAKRAGLLGKSLRVALDTKPILGRGAVKDTFNLLAEGIRKLARTLAAANSDKLNAYLQQNGLERYAEASIKGSADLDWSDDAAVQQLLTEIVADAKCLLAQITPENDAQKEAANLLAQILCQDIEEKPTPEGGSSTGIKEGTAPDRVPSISDPEIRHGRKSASKRFDGHKADISVDIESQIIVAFDVLPGNAGDAANALSQIEASEQNTGLPVKESAGDCAYGGGETRNAFELAGRTLHAKVPKEAKRGDLYPKSAFYINLEAGRVTCPAGHTVTAFTETANGKQYTFGKRCRDCPLKPACTKSKAGRSVSVLAHEALVAKAREYQATPAGRSTLRERVVVEHRLARLGQLGIGQARYCGREKTKFQLGMVSAIANLRRTWNWASGNAA